MLSGGLQRVKGSSGSGDSAGRGTRPVKGLERLRGRPNSAPPSTPPSTPPPHKPPRPRNQTIPTPSKPKNDFRPQDQIHPRAQDPNPPQRHPTNRKLPTIAQSTSKTSRKRPHNRGKGEAQGVRAKPNGGVRGAKPLPGRGVGAAPPQDNAKQERPTPRGHGPSILRSPDGIRTRATALRGRRPRPLDDGART